MNLKIDLKDPKYCDGCPCISFGDIKGRMFYKCSFFNHKLSYMKCDFEKGWLPIKRPQRCIKENDE